MKKIISLFQRNYDGDRLVLPEIVPGADWVLAGEGVPTRKFDGTCCLVRGGKLFKRYEIKPGGKAPPHFEPASEVDAETGKQQGWLPVADGPEDKWHRQAFTNDLLIARTEGTFELCGPKVQGNPEREYVESIVGPEMHMLIPHGRYIYGPPFPCPGWYEGNEAQGFFDELKAWFFDQDIEGVVWHHPDGRMVKIKKKDFGLKRKPRITPSNSPPT